MFRRKKQDDISTSSVDIRPEKLASALEKVRQVKPTMRDEIDYIVDEVMRYSGMRRSRRVKGADQELWDETFAVLTNGNCDERVGVLAS